MDTTNNQNRILIGIAIVAIISFAIYFLVFPKNMLYNIIGNNNQGESSTWKNYFDSKTGLSFQYPEALNKKYIDPVDWPPKINLANGPFSCTQARAETEQAGKTQEITVNGHTYCVTKFTEGAAGSIYTLYAYAFEKAGKIVIFSFGLRRVQCPNYQEPQKTECANEQNSFSIDTLIDQMAETLKI